MTKTITDKLFATVQAVTDVGKLFAAPALKGRIGLDVHIQRGLLATGKTVRLHGLGSEEKVEIVCIEMLSNPHDPNVVRIICSKPKRLALPTGKVEGWIIAET
jgi:hypothetical protein